MKRTGFKRKVYAPASAPLTPIQMEMLERIKTGPARLLAKPKAEPVRHEGYRRLVASMPCAWCGAQGYSQAAHGNAGKGMAMKTDDRTCFPLCGPRPGDPGCHHVFDQGHVLTKASRRMLEDRWGRDTRKKIRERGLWPADLKPWPDDQS